MYEGSVEMIFNRTSGCSSRKNFKAKGMTWSTVSCFPTSGATFKIEPPSALRTCMFISLIICSREGKMYLFYETTNVKNVLRTMAKLAATIWPLNFYAKCLCVADFRCRTNNERET